jgi:hypothetical protein
MEEEEQEAEGSEQNRWAAHAKQVQLLFGEKSFLVRAYSNYG